MKRFWREVAVVRAGNGWQATLDGRGVKTQGGAAQVVPSAALADALAAEWAAQAEDVDAAAFVQRDLADVAIDTIAPAPHAAVAALLAYAETDTLLYRAPPGDPLHARQLATWEPLVAVAETRWDVRFERVAGVVHRPQPATALARLRGALETLDPFRLAALTTLTTLSASLLTGLAALEEGADIGALWAATGLEEAFQAERWGQDAEAATRTARRHTAFAAAAEFARLL